MKKYGLVVLSFIFSCTFSNAQTENADFDSTLAKSLGADAYGMKMYILVLLKTGTNNTADPVFQDSLFTGHLKNISRLADQGDLVVAGPFAKNKAYRGLFILNVQTFEEAERLLETDPAIKSDLLDFDLFMWYGSAALSETLKIHRRIQKNAF